MIGVRSSWLASLTNARWLAADDSIEANEPSSRSSIALNVRASSAISSDPVTGMRRVMSVCVIERAVSRSSRSGARMRPASTHASAAASRRTEPSTTAATRTASVTSSRSAPSAESTTNVPRTPSPVIGTATYRTSPPAVSAFPRSVRVSPAQRGTSGPSRGEPPRSDERWSYTRPSTIATTVSPGPGTLRSKYASKTARRSPSGASRRNSSTSWVSWASTRSDTRARRISRSTTSDSTVEEARTTTNASRRRVRVEASSRAIGGRAG